MKVAPEQARANIIAAYERQHREGVSALTSAIDRVKASQTEKVKPETASVRKSSLASLLLAGRDE
jgi:hypothetical protein